MAGWWPFHCPECHRFVGKIVGFVGMHMDGYGGYYVKKVEGTCKVHGRVEAVGDFGWEEVFGDWDPEEDRRAQRV